MSWNIAKPGDQINGPVAVTGNLNVDSNTLFVDSANNRVGVLTALPTVPLDVVGDAKVSGNLTVDTNTLVVDAANNRLGIGTATPSYALHSVVTSGASAAFKASTAAATYALVGNTAGDLVIQTDASGNGQIYADTGKTLGLRANGSGTSHFLIASDGVCTWSNVGGVAGTAMTLNGTGLGVGGSPTAKLTVYTNGDNIAQLKCGSTTAGATNRLSFINASGAADARTGVIEWYDVGTFKGDFRFLKAGGIQIRNSADSPTFTLEDGGNVGIGTATPIPYAANARALHIDGGANSSEIRLTNNTTGTANTDGGLLTMSGSNLYVWNNENASVIFGTNNGTKATLDGSGNLGLGTASFGTSAAKVLGLANATAPTTSPAGMGQLYVENGALKYRGSSGTVTTIANA